MDEILLIRNVLNHCTEKFKGSHRSELQILRIYFEGVHDIATGRQLAKTYIQSDSNNFNLCYAYADMELSNGNIKQARTIFDKVLRSCGTESMRKDIIILIRAFAELEFSQRNVNNPHWEISVLNILLTIPEKTYNVLGKNIKQAAEAFTKARYLKARKLYSDEFLIQKEYLKKEKHPRIFADFLYCYILFEYMTNTLESADQIFKSGITFLEEESPAKTVFGSDYLLQVEKLSVSYATIVSIHSHTVKTTPPAVLRTVLSDAVSKQPMNICLLSMFIEHESKSKISGRLRLHFDRVCPKAGSTLLWYFAIKTENLPGSGERIKNIFEKALKDESLTRRSAILWHHYLIFELSRNNIESAKKIYYRAIRSVPWYKPVWLECIRHLMNSFNTGELTDIIRLISEKEIRLHIEPST